MLCVLCACCVCRTSWVLRACCLCLCHAVPHLLFLRFTPKLSSRMRVRYIFLSFSSLFLYPGADLIVPLASPIYHVYGNPDLSCAACYFLFFVLCVPVVCPVFSLRAVCSVCLLCVPYELGIACVLCVSAVRCVLCVGPAVHHSVTQSRTCSAFISHPETTSTDAYTIPWYDVSSRFRPFSCTPGLIIHCPSRFHVTTFIETPVHAYTI